jgi:hypothetical protein
LFLIANLTKERNHFLTNVLLSASDNAEIVVTGSGVIHVVGFYEDEPDDISYDAGDL